MKTSKDYYSKPNQNIKYVNKEDDLKTIQQKRNAIDIVYITAELDEYKLKTREVILLQKLSGHRYLEVG